jgi:hypothetical protein
MNSYNSKYYKKNKEKEKKRVCFYRKKNPEKVKVWENERYKRDREKRLKAAKTYAEKNKEKIKEYQKLYRQKNKERSKEYHIKYRADNREFLNKKHSKRINSDPLKKLIRNMRSGLSRCLSGKTKGKLTHLEYSAQELRTHIESLFQPGMSWSNYGRWGWHVDHKIPLQFKELGKYYWSQEALKSPSSTEFKRAWSLSNLKPMWARDNIAKSNRYRE